MIIKGDYGREMVLQQKARVSFSTVLSVLLLSFPLSLSLSLSLNGMITTAVQRIGSEVVSQRRVGPKCHFIFIFVVYVVVVVVVVVEWNDKHR